MRNWEDNWIPRDGVLKPYTPTLSNSDLVFVRDLFCENGGAWDEDKITAVFWDVDIGDILQTPISPSLVDLRTWHYTKSGHYSVRSGYHLARDIRASEIGNMDGQMADQFIRYR